MITLDPKAVGLFVLLVFPGLVSTAIYRLIMPARTVEWGNAVVQGLFYSTANFALALPLVTWLLVGYDPAQHLVRYSVAGVLLLLILPSIWPLVLVAIFKSTWITQRIQIPYPTAWDFFFDQDRPALLLIHLKDGALIGGYWGRGSYAGVYPNDGDIYLEAVYSVDATGRFGAPIENTRGVLLRKEQYSYIEFFSTSESGVIHHGSTE